MNVKKGYKNIKVIINESNLICKMNVYVQFIFLIEIRIWECCVVV